MTEPAPDDAADWHWQIHATCRGLDPELFFPFKTADHRDIAKAKWYCGRCPVRDDCLAYALNHGEDFGLWGGLTEDERTKIHGRKVRDPEATPVDDLLERRDELAALAAQALRAGEIAERMGSSAQAVTKALKVLATTLNDNPGQTAETGKAA